MYYNMDKIKEEDYDSFFDTNSDYWKWRAVSMLMQLKARIGDDSYTIWREMVGERTWGAVHLLAVHGLNRPDELLQSLECTCNEVVGIPCRPCRAAARVRARGSDSIHVSG